jgi:hypothetical protein
MGVTVVLQRCSSHVSVVLQQCNYSVTVMLQWCVTLSPPCSSLSFFMVWFLSACYAVVTLLLHCCYTVVTLSSHCCRTVVALLFSCCKNVRMCGVNWFFSVSRHVVKPKTTTATPSLAQHQHDCTTFKYRMSCHTMASMNFWCPSLTSGPPMPTWHVRKKRLWCYRVLESRSNGHDVT